MVTQEEAIDYLNNLFLNPRRDSQDEEEAKLCKKQIHDFIISSTDLRRQLSDLEQSEEFLTCKVNELTEALSEVTAERDRLFELAYPDGPESDAAIPCSRYRELEDRLKRFENYMFSVGAMQKPPCFCCGYNGPGYFNSKKHPCAKRHYDLFDPISELETIQDRVFPTGVS